MKKNLFLFLPFICALLFTACTGNQCDVTGSWNVKSVDIVSGKWPASIADMTKSEYLKTSYQFQEDGSLTISTPTSTQQPTLTWSIDQGAGVITWKGQDESLAPEVFQILGCTENELTLKQRIPADPSLEESATIDLVLERTE